MKHLLKILPNGNIRCLYTEAIDLHKLGTLTMERAGTIEFNTGTQLWEVTDRRVRCPATRRYEGDIIGCGGTNLTGPDDEGFFDCLDCGLFFLLRARAEPSVIFSSPSRQACLDWEREYFNAELAK